MKIRLLHSGDGDWQGLYIDGKLVAEDHSLHLSEVIKFLIPNVDFKSIYDEKESYLERFGNRCPKEWPIDEFGE